MGKYQNQNQKQSNAGPIAVLVIAVAVLVVCLTVFLPRMGSGQSSAAPTEIQSLQPGTVTEAAGTSAETGAAGSMELPLSLESGMLVIQSLFQYEGINPDCGNQEGRNIGAITLENTSGTYLAEAAIALELTDGTKLNFTVTNLPAGKSAMVFAADNTPIPADPVCSAVSCEAAWDSTASAESEQVSVSVDGMVITLTNNTSRDISELVVYCRSPLDEEYFGGITYLYTVNDLPANGTATVEAWDCILGMAEVVRIAINQE